jgi:hypothetical protein
MTPMTSVQRATLKGYAALCALRQLEIRAAQDGHWPKDSEAIAWEARRVSGALGMVVTHERARRRFLTR